MDLTYLAPFTIERVMDKKYGMTPRRSIMFIPALMNLKLKKIHIYIRRIFTSAENIFYTQMRRLVILQEIDLKLFLDTILTILGERL